MNLEVKFDVESPDYDWLRGLLQDIRNKTVSKGEDIISDIGP